MDLLQRRLLEWFRKGERVLLPAAVAGLLLLLCCQLIMTVPKARYYLNPVESLEGAPYQWAEALSSTSAWNDSRTHIFEDIYWIECGLRSGCGPLELLCNGERAGTLTAAKPLLIYVRPGDLLEFRGEAVSDETLVVEILSTRGLSYPYPGVQIEAAGGERTLIGWAITGNEGESRKKEARERN